MYKLALVCTQCTLVQVAEIAVIYMYLLIYLL